MQCKSYKLNGIPIIQGTNGFEVESVSSHAIQVKHSSCPSVTLLSPYRIFNDVHNSSVSIMYFLQIKDFTLKLLIVLQVTSLDVIGGQCVSASDSVLKSWSSLDHEKEKEVRLFKMYLSFKKC